MTSNQRFPVAGAALAAMAALVTVASPSSAAGSRTHVVRAQHVLFTPSRLIIRRGDRVTWKFLDSGLRIKHTVTSAGARHFADMPTERLTGSFTARFSKPGVYMYICTNHEASMHAVIVVR